MITRNYDYPAIMITRNYDYPELISRNCSRCYFPESYDSADYPESNTQKLEKRWELWFVSIFW